jgi:hypothetical protein
MPVVHDADPWVRPALGGRENSWGYGIDRDGPGPEADLSFADLVDILNPLQHVPLLSSLYRAVTGDEIQPSAQIMGATLYGGPIGFAAATNLAIVQQAAGDTPGGLLIAALMGEDETQEPQDLAQFDGAQLDGDDDMPLPAGGEGAGTVSAQVEPGPWPPGRWSDRDPLIESPAWRQDWQARPRDTAPATAADAAALQVADPGPVKSELAAVTDGSEQPTASPDSLWSAGAAFRPFRRVG